MGWTPKQLADATGDWTLEQAGLFLRQWGERYPEVFTLDQALTHRDALAALTPAKPVTLLVAETAGGALACTVIAFDYPALFSLITGILGAAGFDIVSGDVFTSVPPAAAPARYGPRRRRPVAKGPRRSIIDHFRGRRQTAEPTADWAREWQDRLREVVLLLETGRAETAVRARHLVYELVARRLGTLNAGSEPTLYPVEFDIDNDGAFTRLQVRSQDTPFFLYSLSNALALRGITIERVTISTTESGQVSDCIDILDRHGRRIADRQDLDELRFSVALTKQFTYCLGTAHDPYAALTRFEQLTEEIAHAPDRGIWLDRLGRTESMRDLARILGASDFLWEDFIRSQYETLLPLLQERATRRPLDLSADGLRRQVSETLAACRSPAEQRDALNAWKDRIIFQIDLNHILGDDPDVRRLAEPLTRVAELVVEKAFDLVGAQLAQRYGTPRTVAGMPTAFAVCGLGKLGGVALGYASDIELLCVYGDSGMTDGPDSIANAEYFERLVQETVGSVTTKCEGVFQIDLRLRPYGKAGPLACSLDSFCRYYGPGGAALSYERLALVRLRAIAGDADLGARIERLRDQFVYASAAISIPELQELRDKQVAAKTSREGVNAKFDPGALVDIEYCVQMLQVMHGGTHEVLRTPRIHEALGALSRVGVLEPEESRRLTRAYYFLRRLINGLRMLRGNALDLFLPAPGSIEYRHLARRMGYERRHELDVGRQLFVDFETETAVVRRFVDRHFGRRTGSGPGNVVDLLLADAPPRDQVERILRRAGLRDPQRALTNLRRLAGSDDQSEVFLRLAVLAMDVLQLTADPDMALNNWERFACRLPAPSVHFSNLLLQPRRLEILLGVFAASQFLADTLVRDPDFMEWVTDSEVLNRDDTVAGRLAALQALLPPQQSPHEQRLEAVRRFRRREILRIGIRDLFLQLPIQRVTADLADLAETIVEWCTLENARLLAEGAASSPDLGDFCILAFGKCGGRELNYSSDIDLVGLFREAEAGVPAQRSFFETLLERVRADLMGHGSEGFLYRVDFRLRPYGRAGSLCPSVRAFERYYHTDARLWEKQALLKARPIAGNRALGDEALSTLRPVLAAPHDPAQVVASIRHMRRQALARQNDAETIDIKDGAGGIRDIEFLVQALQLAHAHRDHALVCPGTIPAIEALVNARLLDRETGRGLLDNYLLLRRVEHFLQLLEDRQTHVLPQRPESRDALARRVFGPSCSGAAFMDRVAAITADTAERCRLGLERLDAATQN